LPSRAQPQRSLLRVFALPSSALSSSGLAPRAEGLQAPRRTAETDGNTLPLLVPIPRGFGREHARVGCIEWLLHLAEKRAEHPSRIVLFVGSQ
jgi:hypothetical protein